ncbi:OFA family MFS transporter [Paenibacillus polymyxa]|uniref:L-lactate MFS transporter n=1 Tax=Paenibacillus polymyxa TaxID=1406 RepID=UPI0025B6ABD3|nr:OFA family MFS transporter [Paenibacillus polymyxa]MDN4077714.1 OFA family MFS transporter [Paenibacillus polymyxa]MDN4103138.1 OFA family MFS transporter [Paenibacillus polymyxa]MDN4114229.1 OFA family MFS transporter [Paenibacillus polymyxa]
MKSNSGNRLLVVLGTIIVQMGLGTIYTWSLFNQPLVDRFGWNLSSVAITFSITSFALAFATLFAGKLQDKWGLRRLILCAGIVLGAGLMLSSQVTSLSLLYILAGIVVGFADGTAYITSLSNLIKWFPEKKGLISGISVGAYGTGSLIFKYINGSLIQSVGVSQAFLYWGIIVLIMIVGGSFLVKEAVVINKPSVQNGAVQWDYTVKEMLRTKQAYLLFVMFFTACMSGLYLIGVVKDIGVRMAGLDVATAANAVAMVAIFNTAGRIILGALSDKVGRLKVVAGALLTTAVAVTVLSLVPLNFGLFFACVAGIAFCFGGNITVFPAIVADFFGLKNQSKNYGIVYQGFGLGALAGSFIAALLGGFIPTFTTIAVLCVVSFLIALTICTPEQGKGKLRSERKKNTNGVRSMKPGTKLG